MANSSPTQLLSSINHQRSTNPLSILSLAEPILTSDLQSQASQSHSQSQNGTTNLTPSSLSADLTHYRELFSKLRFSYLEQVTKEKYLRGIVGEPPILATSAENAALEDRLAVMKIDLQAKKRNVEALVQEMETLARDIAERYDGVDLAVRQLEILPREIEGLEQEVEDLSRRVAEEQGEVERSEDPRMNLSLEETERLLQEQRARSGELQQQIQDLEREMPSKTRECERAERELQEVEIRRNEITRLARDAQRMKEAGGRDLLEEQGRWYRSSEVVMKGLLGVQS